jgi:hypothetical protein
MTDKTKDQELSNQMLCHCLCSLEVLHNRFVDDQKTHIFENFIKFEFINKTDEDLFSQAYCQIYNFKYSYELCVNKYKCDYNYHIGQSKNNIIDFLNKYLNEVENGNFKILCKFLIGILEDKELTEFTVNYKSLFTKKKEIGKNELLTKIPYVLSNIDNDTLKGEIKNIEKNTDTDKKVFSNKNIDDENVNENKQNVKKKNSENKPFNCLLF